VAQAKYGNSGHFGRWQEEDDYFFADAAWKEGSCLEARIDNAYIRGVALQRLMYETLDSYIRNGPDVH
jgi:hypothetical protein